MKITIYNFKGGVGKTVIALNLALTMGYSIVTNDIYSPIETVLPENRILKIGHDEDIPVFPDGYDIIFDLGGHIEKRSISAIKQSQWILVPVNNDFINLQVTIDAITEIQTINRSIIVLANRTSKTDFEHITAAINQFFTFPVFEIKNSKSLPNIFTEKKSIADMVKAGGLKRYHYEIVAHQFDLVIRYLKERVT